MRTPRVRSSGIAGTLRNLGQARTPPARGDKITGTRLIGRTLVVLAVIVASARRSEEQPA